MDKILKTLSELNSYVQEKGVDGQLTYRGEVSHLLRCAVSQVSLNVSEASQTLYVELQQGKRAASGSYKGSIENIDQIKNVIDTVYSSIDSTPEVDFLKPMEPIAQDVKVPAKEIDSNVEDIDSKVMVSIFEKAAERFKNDKVHVSGAFSAGSADYAVINTKSPEPLYHKGTDYNVEVVLQMLEADKKELRAAYTGEDLSTYNEQEVLDHLEHILRLKQETQREDLKPGKYKVVFGADAFGELVSMFGYLSLSGESFEYQTGMLQKDKHKLGDKIFSEKLTMVDDPNRDDVLYARHFGMNGIKRDAFPLIENGVLKNFYYSDKKTCDRFNKTVNNDAGVGSVKILNGDGVDTFKELINNSSEPVIYIPFIHYMNITNAPKGEITGTSRFGTFLIENGEVKHHLYNLRINDSLHNILSQINWLSKGTTHVNTSNTYGLRNPSSIACPSFVCVDDVYISGTNKQPD